MSPVKNFTFRPRGREHIELFRAGRIRGEIELIYWWPSDVKRHRDAPLVREREQFLLHFLKQGSSQIMVQNMAAMLLRAIEALNIKILQPLGSEEVVRATEKTWGKGILSDSKRPGHNPALMFRFCLKNFLRFHSELKSRETARQPFAQELDRFSAKLWKYRIPSIPAF